MLQSGVLCPPFFVFVKSYLDFKFILSFNLLELDFASCQDAIVEIEVKDKSLYIPGEKILELL